MARTRVFLVAPSLAPGGSETVLVRLASCLDRERFETEAATLAGAGPLAAALPPDVPLHTIGARRVAYALPAFIRLVRKRRPAAILSFQIHVNIALLLLRPLLPRGIRIVVREESMPSRSCADSPLPRVFAFLVRRLYPRADVVITQCEAAAEELTGRFGVPEYTIRVISNPVDIEDVRTKAAGGEDDAHLPPSPRLVFVGRLAAVKRVDVILDAFARMRRRVSLVIVGGGDEDALRMLKARAADLGVAERVFFAGHQANPYPYMRHARLLVLASLREGYNLAVLEARCLGVPTVAAAAPGCLPEIIDHGTNGFLAPFHIDNDRQAAALAESLDHALDSLEKPPGGMDLATGSASWALEAVCRAHESALEADGVPHSTV